MFNDKFLKKLSAFDSFEKQPCFRAYRSTNDGLRTIWEIHSKLKENQIWVRGVILDHLERDLRSVMAVIPFCFNHKNMASGLAMSETTVPIRTLKLSSIGQEQHWDERLLRNSWCCWLMLIYWCSLEKRVKSCPPPGDCIMVWLWHSWPRDAGKSPRSVFHWVKATSCPCTLTIRAAFDVDQGYAQLMWFC